MKTAITIEKDIFGNILFRGAVAISDLERWQPEHYDVLLIEDCYKPGSSGADWLLALEHVFRQLEKLK